MVRVHFARIVKRFKNVTKSKIIPRGSLLSIEDLKHLNEFAESMRRLYTIVHDAGFWDYLTPRQLRKYNKWSHEIAKQNEELYRSIFKTIKKREALRLVEQNVENVVELE